MAALHSRCLLASEKEVGSSGTVDKEDVLVREVEGLMKGHGMVPSWWILGHQILTFDPVIMRWDDWWGIIREDKREACETLEDVWEDELGLGIEAYEKALEDSGTKELEEVDGPEELLGGDKGDVLVVG